MPLDSPTMTPPISGQRAQPRSPADLFFSFTVIALQGFGGVMAIIQRELVDRKGWMTQEEFVEEWGVAQLMPGPNVVNMALMIGGRYFGLRGALAAVAGMLALPMVVVLLLALTYAQFAGNPAVAGALRGMSAVTAGLIAANGFKLLGTLKTHPLGLPWCIGLGLPCFVMIAVLRWPLLYVLLGLGAVGCVLTYRKLKP